MAGAGGAVLARAVISLVAPVRPVTWDRIQVAPAGDVHIAACSWPGEPYWAATVKPAPGPGVSAVMAVSGPGVEKGTTCQLRPPLAEVSASGAGPPGRCCRPR